QDVSASFDLSDISVQDTTHSTTVTPSGFSFSGNTLTVNFSGVLADANYTATLIASGITNSDGTPMAANYDQKFFFLSADGNHDRTVNVLDFNILASNYNTSGKTFSQGNYNYDAGGTVNVLDFNILASQYNKNLP